MKANKASVTNQQNQELINLTCLYEITRHLASATSLQDRNNFV